MKCIFQDTSHLLWAIFLTSLSGNALSVKPQGHLMTEDIDEFLRSGKCGQVPPNALQLLLQPLEFAMTQGGPVFNGTCMRPYPRDEYTKIPDTVGSFCSLGFDTLKEACATKPSNSVNIELCRPMAATLLSDVCEALSSWVNNTSIMHHHAHQMFGEHCPLTCSGEVVKSWAQAPANKDCYALYCGRKVLRAMNGSSLESSAAVSPAAGRASVGLPGQSASAAAAGSSTAAAETGGSTVPPPTSTAATAATAQSSGRAAVGGDEAGAAGAVSDAAGSPGQPAFGGPPDDASKTGAAAPDSSVVSAGAGPAGRRPASSPTPAAGPGPAEVSPPPLAGATPSARPGAPQQHRLTPDATGPGDSAALPSEANMSRQSSPGSAPSPAAGLSPVQGAPRPAQGAPRPAPAADLTAQGAPRPAPAADLTGQEHALSAETPNGLADAPKDSAETLKDSVETPKDTVETPKDTIETPKDTVETPNDSVQPSGDVLNRPPQTPGDPALLSKESSPPPSSPAAAAQPAVTAAARPPVSGPPSVAGSPPPPPPPPPRPSVSAPLLPEQGADYGGGIDSYEVGTGAAGGGADDFSISEQRPVYKAPSGSMPVDQQPGLGPRMGGALPAQGGDSNFFAYFLTAVVLCVVLYLMFHNKQKILALVIEGRSPAGRRRPHSSQYRRLDNSLEEAISSQQRQDVANSIIY